MLHAWVNTGLILFRSVLIKHNADERWLEGPPRNFCLRPQQTLKSPLITKERGVSDGGESEGRERGMGSSGKGDTGSTVLLYGSEGPTSPGHQVCVYDGAAQLPEHGGDGAFPRGDATRQPHQEHDPGGQTDSRRGM